MDADDLYQFSQLEIFRSWKIERRPCTGDGPEWIVEITTNDPTEITTHRGKGTLAAAIESCMQTVFYREKMRLGDYREEHRQTARDVL